MDWIDRRSEFNELLRNTAADLAARLKKGGSVACFEPGIDVLTINDRFAISLRLARSWRGSGREPIWTINRRAILPDGHIIAIRLGEGNNSVLDYVLLPTREMIGSKVRFMEAGLHRFDGRRFRTFRSRPNNRDQASPKEGPTARGADRAKIQIGSNEHSVVLFEITVELRYLDKLRKLSRHEILPTKRQAPHKPLICPTGQVRVGSKGEILAATNIDVLTAIAPWPPLRAVRRAADIWMRESFADQDLTDIPAADRQRAAQAAVVAVASAFLSWPAGARHAT